MSPKRIRNIAQVYKIISYILQNKNLLQILGARGSYIEGPNWRILAQQVFKMTVLSPGVLLYFINGLSHEHKHEREWRLVIKPYNLKT